MVSVNKVNIYLQLFKKTLLTLHRIHINFIYFYVPQLELEKDLYHPKSNDLETFNITALSSHNNLY